jgi:hypothetical protein
LIENRVFEKSEFLGECPGLPAPLLVLEPRLGLGLELELEVGLEVEPETGLELKLE